MATNRSILSPRGAGDRFNDSRNPQRGSTGHNSVTREGKTNANDYTPSYRGRLDDVLEEEGSRIERGTTPTGRGAARTAQQMSGVRAATRALGVGANAELALEAGYKLGRAIDEETGAGKKTVDNSQVLKAVSRKLADSDKVSLTKDAKERIAEIENDKTMREVDKEKEASKYGKGDNSAYAKGGMVVNKGIGASMKAHNGFTSKGKK